MSRLGLIAALIAKLGNPAYVRLLPAGFKESEYLRLNPDVAAAVGDGRVRSGVSHWLRHGRQEGRRFAVSAGEEGLPADFDERIYLELHPDVAHAVSIGEQRSGAHHWLHAGRGEGRAYIFDLPADFDDAVYLESHPDVAKAVGHGAYVSGASHWRTYGRLEARRSWARLDRSQLPADFDEEDYLRRYPDVAAVVNNFGYLSGASHWLAVGRREGRLGAVSRSEAPTRKPTAAPSQADSLGEMSTGPQDFQASAYASHYPDVADEIGSDPDRLVEHWRTFGYREGRTPFGYCPYAHRKASRAFWGRGRAITFYGFLNDPSGLGAAARGYQAALATAGYDVTSVTVEGIENRFETKPDVRAGRPGSGIASQSRVNIYNLNADMVHRFFLDERMHLLDDSFNIGIWAWELAHFRPDWASAFGAFDELWVPSEFCRQAVSAISPVPVYVVPHVVQLPRPPKHLPRDHFHIPENTYLFGYVFDVGSLIERKNPRAVISAFIAAFADRSDVMLAIKYHGAHHGLDHIKMLHAMAAGHSNIRFFGMVWDEEQLVSFKSMLDCYVSPHRSEGFGLNIAESMLLGTPVIATRYSGNVDFMDDENSFPVDCKLIELGQQIGPYPPDALWADPDPSDLRDKMQLVASNRMLATRRGMKARSDISQKYSLDAIARIIKTRLDDTGVFLTAPKFLGVWRQGVGYTYKEQHPAETKISIVVPVYNIDPDLLTKCIQSVLRQTYGNWELVLHDDGSDREDTLAVLLSFRGSDHRIKVSLGGRNQGIAAATNMCIALSSGEFIAFLDNDDELAATALAEVAAAIGQTPDADLLYTDEDKLDIDGGHCDHYLKPDMSPEHLESNGYFLHMMVVRRSVLLSIGGLRAKYDGAQDFDLALRVSRVARRIVHVPSVLYHWRKIPGSAASQVDAKPVALQHAVQALQDHLDASGRNAVVAPGLLPGLFRVRDSIRPGLPVTLVIPTDNRVAAVRNRGTINLFDNFFRSIITKTETICDVRVLAVDNGNLSSEQRAAVEEAGGSVLSFQGSRSAFSMAKKINFALPHVGTEMVIILNDDMEVISPGWVDALMELAQRPTSGVVGARLLYPDDRIQHAGMVFGINNHVAHVFHQLPVDQVGYNGYTHIIRNYLSVTGACMATKMSIFDEVGGFDEAFAVDYNDTDFCMRVHSAGYRNIYTPFATLYHFEGTTQVRSQPNPTEHELFVRKWKGFMARDPFYNPNLTRLRYDFSEAP